MKSLRLPYNTFNFLHLITQFFGLVPRIPPETAIKNGFGTMEGNSFRVATPIGHLDEPDKRGNLRSPAIVMQF